MIAFFLALALAADLDGDGFEPPVDCDDTNDQIHIDAVELCNGVDDNCNNEVDEAAADRTQVTDPTCVPHHLDADLDGYGDSSGPPSGGWCLCADGPEEDGADCDGPAGAGVRIGGECFVVDAGDCDDMNVAIHLGATETCNQLDDDCDTEVDEGLDGCDPAAETDPETDGDTDTTEEADGGGCGCDSPGAPVGLLTATLAWMTRRRRR